MIIKYPFYGNSNSTNWMLEINALSWPDRDEKTVPRKGLPIYCILLANGQVLGLTHRCEKEQVLLVNTIYYLLC